MNKTLQSAFLTVFLGLILSACGPGFSMAPQTNFAGEAGRQSGGQNPFEYSRPPEVIQNPAQTVSSKTQRPSAEAKPSTGSELVTVKWPKAPEMGLGVSVFDIDPTTGDGSYVSSTKLSQEEIEKMLADEVQMSEAEPPLAPGVKREDIQAKGTVIPTVYFFATLNEDTRSCKTSERVRLLNPQGKTLAMVCPYTYEECALQGTCMIYQNGKTRSFNVHSKRGGITRFFEIDDNSCRYGYGVQNICLEPFRTVAADLSLYKPGEVLYVPSVVGAVLPGNMKHDGFFIVRDKGAMIKGKGRFDFYTGFMSWKDQSNPLVKLGLSDERTRLPYYRLKEGKLSQKIRQTRGYPGLSKGR